MQYEYDDAGYVVSEPVDLLQKHYYLQDSNDQHYLSENPGQLGSYYKLKIYGRLDCPTSARYLAEWHYDRHRVIFENYDIAIAAGYRPCGICMNYAYKNGSKRILDRRHNMDSALVAEKNMSAGIVAVVTSK